MQHQASESWVSLPDTRKMPIREVMIGEDLISRGLIMELR